MVGMQKTLLLADGGIVNQVAVVIKCHFQYHVYSSVVSYHYSV